MKRIPRTRLGPRGFRGQGWSEEDTPLAAGACGLARTAQHRKHAVCLPCVLGLLHAPRHHTQNGESIAQNGETQRNNNPLEPVLARGEAHWRALEGARAAADRPLHLGRVHAGVGEGVIEARDAVVSPRIHLAARGGGASCMRTRTPSLKTTPSPRLAPPRSPDSLFLFLVSSDAEKCDRMKGGGAVGECTGEPAIMPSCTTPSPAR